MKKLFYVIVMWMTCVMGSHAQAQVRSVTWDALSLMIDNKRVVPVMGEIHYSRIPQEEWLSELRKMKDGGVTIVATYVFWNHVEEVEGQFDWSGQRNLRAFLELCKTEGLPVILRLGPFCHGEVRNGGIPDWVFAKVKKTRVQSEDFMRLTRSLYRQIFTQVQGLQWKDGGPVIACQFDNEYRGSGDYLMALKREALAIGFDLPFYTRTGWPELSKPVPFGEMLPLYGDYADGFWERSVDEGAGSYWKAFFFKSFRSSTAIASEQLGVQQEKLNQGDELYPYFTCELGGGMITSYHRRVYMYPDDAYAMAIVKLGSGSNLLGYYMYHGGTNPEGRLHYLNETQRSIATNYNDLPVKSYEYQAPLGEFGQIQETFYRLRPLHLFMNHYAEELAPMEAVFPNDQEPKQGDDGYLRWSYRHKDNSGFVFFSNYERLQSLTDKKGVQFDVCGVTFPSRPVTIPAGAIGVLPVNIGDIRYATAQLVARSDGKVYLMQIPGMETEIAVGNKVLRKVKPKGKDIPVYRNIYLLTRQEAERLFLDPIPESTSTPVGYTKTKEAGESRTITIGVQKVAEQPTDEDFDDAAVYMIDIPKEKEGKLLEIQYQGDCARLYADGKLVNDNFYNGLPFLMGLWRLPEDCVQLELRVLPMQSNEPVYFPKEADTTPGEKVMAVNIIQE